MFDHLPGLVLSFELLLFYSFTATTIGVNYKTCGNVTSASKQDHTVEHMNLLHKTASLSICLVHVPTVLYCNGLYTHTALPVQSRLLHDTTFRRRSYCTYCTEVSDASMAARTGVRLTNGMF